MSMMIELFAAIILAGANVIYSVLKIKEDLSAGRTRLAIFGMSASLGVPLYLITFIELISSFGF